MKQFKIVVEKHSEGYVAYPVGLKGIVVGEGNCYEEACLMSGPPFVFTLRRSAKKFLRLSRRS